MAKVVVSAARAGIDDFPRVETQYSYERTPYCASNGALAIGVHHMFPMSTPKNPGKAIAISQPQDTDARIEGFRSRLIESNQVLAAALVRLRDFYLAGAPPLVTDNVLAQVETALEMAKRVENGF